MPDKPQDPQSSLRQLYDENWLVRATAARSLMNFPEITLSEIARFFELTLDEKAPVREVSRIAIEHMKSAAIPYLLGQARSLDSRRREGAIELLSLIGQCGGEPYRFATQILGPRNKQPPAWGDRTEEVFQMLSQATSDTAFPVQFAAASVLDDCNRLAERTIGIFIEALSKGTSFQKNWAALRLGRLGPMARAAGKTITDFAAGLANEQDVWDMYARRAAKVALERIGCADMD